MDVGKLLFKGEQVEAFLDVVAVVTEAAGSPSQLFVIRGHHAAFAASGEGLVLAEAARIDVTKRTGLAALVFAANSLGVVFNDKQVVLLGESVELVHIADVAVQVDRDDRLGALIDQLFSGFDADAVVVDVDVSKARNRAGLDD